MVGVPGKSKGCVTCRRRKIKCDERRPTCGNCEKSRRGCEGYHRDKKFVAHLGPRAINPGRSSSSDSHPAASSSQGMVARRSTSAAQQTAPILVRPLDNPDAFDLHYFKQYMDIISPAGTETPSETNRWLRETFQMSNDGAVRLALRAICVARLGKQHGDESLRQLGHTFYGQALKALQKDLESKETAFTLETVSACRALGSYELWHSIGNSIEGWHTHTKGLARIFEGGGPERFRPALDEGIFLGVRRIFVTWCIVGRRELALSHDDWKPSTRGPRFLEEYLYYLGLRLGALFARLDHAIDPGKDEPIANAHVAQHVIAKLLTLEDEIHEWYRQYETLSPYELPLWWPDPAFAQPEIFNAWGFSFRNNDVAQTHLLFWTLRLLLSVNVGDAALRIIEISEQQVFDNTGTALNDVFTQEYLLSLLERHSTAKRIELANTIVRAATYTTTKRMGLESLHVNTFPLAMSLAELSNHERQGTEFERGTQLYRLVVSKQQAARQWMQGREYLTGEDQTAKAGE